MKRRNFLQKLAMIGGGAATLAATGRSEALPRKLEPKLANSSVDVLDLKSRAKVHYYWSRAPGAFVNKETGKKVTLDIPGFEGPKFSGSVREWYETLIEMIIDVGNTADGIRYERRESDLSGPCFGEGSYEAMLGAFIKVPDIPDAEGKIYVSKDILTLIEQTTLYRSDYRQREDGSIDTSGGGVIYNRYKVIPTDTLKRWELLVHTDRNNVGLLTVMDMAILDPGDDWETYASRKTS